MNSSIPPEIQLEVFKRLDSCQTVKLRQVCGQWLDLINQEKSLWRKITIRDGKNIDCIKSAIDLFNQKSDGTMEEVIILTYLWSTEIDPIIEALERSKSTLTTLSFPANQSPLKLFSRLVSIGFNKLVDFRDCPLDNERRVVEVVRRSRTSGQVLWSASGLSIATKHHEIFTSLISLKFLTHQGSLRLGLQACSETLKHLFLQIIPTRANDTPSYRLQFPNLQVLELDRYISVFPSWMIVPSNLKLFTCSIIPDLPLISELYIKSLIGLESLKSNCPTLEVLWFHDLSPKGLNRLNTSEQERLLELMETRMKNVEEGVEWEGIKMKKLKKLFIPTRTLDVEVIETLRESTEELIDIPELKFPIIELQV